MQNRHTHAGHKHRGRQADLDHKPHPNHQDRRIKQGQIFRDAVLTRKQHARNQNQQNAVERTLWGVQMRLRRECAAKSLISNDLLMHDAFYLNLNLILTLIVQHAPLGQESSVVQAN